jgi:hypothetical protein
MTSVREYIFQNIKTTLEAVTTTAGYNYTLTDKVFLIHGKRDDTAYEEPVVYIYPGMERTVRESGEKGFDYNELEVQLEMWIRAERTTMNTEVNQALADVKTALGADHTRGGYAIYTEFASNEAIIVDLTSDKCAILMSIIVHYEHLYANPYVCGGVV